MVNYFDSMEYIKVNQVLAAVQRDLGQNNNRNSNTLRRYVFEALNDLGAVFLEIKKATLQLDNLKKPEDYVSVKNIYLVKADGGKTQPYYNEMFTCDEIDVLACNPKYTVSENREEFFFNDTADFKCVNLVYYACPVVDGEMAFVQRAYQAVFWYVMHRTAIKDRNKGRGKSARQNPVSVNEMAMYQQKYDEERFSFQSWLASPGGSRFVAEIGEAWLYQRNTFPPGLSLQYSHMF